MNKACRNICGRPFDEHMLSLLFVKYLRVGLLGHMVMYVSLDEKLLNNFTILYIQQQCQSSRCSTSLTSSFGTVSF